MGNLSEREKCLVQLYLKLAPTKMYPCEQILEYNPVRGSAFIERIKSSETSLNAVLMTACYAEMFLQGEWSSPELLYHVSKVRTRIVNEMSKVLYQCGLQSYLANAMISTALFAGVLRLAFASPNREVLLNPEAFIEEWLWCEYQLVLYGGALREDCLNDSLGELDELTVAADLGNSEAVAAAMVRSLYTTKPVPSPAENLLEPVLRAAAIVYLETIVPDEPRNPMVYSVPLNLLSASVHKLTQKLQERQSREADDGEGDLDDGLPSMEALRPVMIWACLVGSVMSKLCETDLVTMGILFDRGYYGQCLSLVIGPEPEHVDRLTEKDLALCKLLDARGLRIRQQDERALLRALLREHAYGCPLLDLAYV
ncbi:hypothetical protein COL922a_001928 [Colletotrichum nupharicola]|nr:hypothetical protein COL922a_001928 [Colletotrichum nupharicola]